ncbi:MAG: hypothetical protein ACKVOQ_10135 [Cyclobacteriaceae bacterium]
MFLRALYIELFKVVNRKSLVILLIVTVIIFPLLVITVTYLESIEENTIQGSFVDTIAAIVIVFMTLLLFLPLWIASFVGQELTNGHVNRIVFSTSRKHYFFLKLIYCLAVSTLFTFLGAIAFLIALKNPAFGSIDLDAGFFLRFIAQIFLIAILYSLTTLCITFAIRSPIPSLVVAYFAPQVESIIYFLFDRLMDIKLNWLPFQLLSSLHKKSGVRTEVDYLNPLVENPIGIVWPILLVTIITYLSYLWFLRRDLKVLSD